MCVGGMHRFAPQHAVNGEGGRLRLTMFPADRSSLAFSLPHRRNVVVPFALAMNGKWKGGRNDGRNISRKSEMFVDGYAFGRDRKWNESGASWTMMMMMV